MLSEKEMFCLKGCENKSETLKKAFFLKSKNDVYFKRSHKNILCNPQEYSWEYRCINPELTLDILFDLGYAFSCSRYQYFQAGSSSSTQFLSSYDLMCTLNVMFNLNVNFHVLL